jgi:hypothetical protein
MQKKIVDEVWYQGYLTTRTMMTKRGVRYDSTDLVKDFRSPRWDGSIHV